MKMRIMPGLAVALAALAGTVLIGADQIPGQAFRPVARTDKNSQLAHEQLLAKAKQGRIDVYFVGDSITRRWGASDAQYRPLLQNWTNNFFGWNAGNFGWGADKIENILWRLENGELAGVNPRIIVILAGINDVGREPGGPEKAALIAEGIKAIVQVCRKQAPAAVIVLTAVLPRNDTMSVVPVIDEVNRQIAKLADGKAIRFLNINSRIAGPDGKFLEGMVNPDKLHPTVQTYQIWADALKPIFVEILGPRAATDSAPPPTGDPSAQLPR
jgi:lysophospholipase L1-like esterase